MNKEDIEKLSNIIKNSDNIVFFSGAGISTKSNIPDFRSAEGIYNQELDINYAPEYLLSRTFFNENPDFFSRYYKEKLINTDAKPNDAHKVVAKLEEMGKVKAVITQNIDNLHQMAGSKNVIEIHGTLSRHYCIDCNKQFPMEYVLRDIGLSRCDECGGVIRPDVVLYEEALDQEALEKSVDYVMRADTLIVVGSSLIVYPAAGLVRYFKGDNLVIINMDDTKYDKIADLVFHEDISDVLSLAMNYEK
ncbi:MAG: NAD-dependent protein deacylase [Andreesenia angusta]|nr:NAD-dependent protein deacylase [Andreesenia angusta]